MNGIRDLGLLCSLLAITSCQTPNTTLAVIPAPVVYHGWGFDMSLPTECKAEKHEMVDFDVYNITKGDVKLLFIYAGFHPSFPQSIPKDVNIRRVSINGRSTKKAEWKESGLTHAQFLIHLPAFDSEAKLLVITPEYLHCIYGPLDEEYSSLADSIIQSIRATKNEQLWQKQS